MVRASIGLPLDTFILHSALTPTNSSRLITRRNICKAFSFTWANRSLWEFASGKILHPSTESPDLTRFSLYTRRVKYANYRQGVKVHPDLLSFLTSYGINLECPAIIPSLLAIRISPAACDRIQLLFGMSRTLRRLNLDLGFNFKTPRIPEARISGYLTNIRRMSPDVRHLSVRGALSQESMDAISSMNNLLTLSLRSGSSLTINTLMALTGFQHLVELELHAAHLNAGDIPPIFLDTRNLPFLPSLKKLHMRAQIILLEFFLALLSSESLHTLHLDAHEPKGIPIAWNHLFTSICGTAGNTLRHLTIERHIELEEPDDSVADNTVLHPRKGNIQVPFDDIRILVKLSKLRSLVLDTTLPPDICDDELETLVTSWPELEHLDLGLLSTPGHVRLQARPPMTSKSLDILACKALKLATVILTMDLSDITLSPNSTNSIPQRALTRMTLGCPSIPGQDMLVPYLHRLYPSLLEIDGLPEHEEIWTGVRVALKDLLPPEVCEIRGDEGLIAVANHGT